MRKITLERLQEILIAHKQWVDTGYVESDTAKRADLQDANLRGAYLRRAYLQDADLRGADLQDAYLQDADLRGADLQDADLQDADLRGADLQDANLRGADLRGAYLQDANLRGADDEKITVKKAPIQISGLRWFVIVWDDHMQIGCEFHSHAHWRVYDDARISRMDDRALEFWREWKDVLLGICKKHSQ